MLTKEKYISTKKTSVIPHLMRDLDFHRKAFEPFLDSRLRGNDKPCVLKKHIVSFFLGIALFATINQKVIAQEDVSFGVDPLTLSIELPTKEETEQKIKIYNLENEEKTYILSVEKFYPTDEKGSLQFEEIKEKEKFPQITFDNNAVTIPANSSAIIDANFYAEANVDEKEYYLIIFITPETIESTTGTNRSKIIGKIGILTFVNVVKKDESGEILGQVIKDGSIVEFSATNPNIFRPVEFHAKVNNTGNIHYEAFGAIKIFNQKDELVKTIPIEKVTVLPGMVRDLNKDGKETLDWDFGARLGTYTAKLEVKSVDQTLSLSDEISFFVVPGKLILIISAVITISFITIIIYINLQNPRHS